MRMVVQNYIKRSKTAGPSSIIPWAFFVDPELKVTTTPFRIYYVYCNTLIEYTYRPFFFFIFGRHRYYY